MLSFDMGESYSVNRNLPWRRLLSVLKEIDGYFVVTDGEGEEYIVVKRSDFERRAPINSEVQLPLPSRTGTGEDILESAGDVLERINREIADYYVQQAEQDFVEPEEESSSLTQSSFTVPPPRRVRFEPLSGDLPPELQE